MDNFSALEKIRDSLKEKIFSIEGKRLNPSYSSITKYPCLVIFAGSQTSGESLKMEMSQLGFSAAYDSEVPKFNKR